jgi:hypothetical protein
MIATAFALSLAAAGCSTDSGGAGTDGADVNPGTDPVESAKARVKFKEQGRFVRDLAAALDLPRTEVCNELGLYDCYEVAHRITLGGVEPYRRGIRDPLPVAPVTAPIAVDRVALSACATRVDRDFDRPSDAVMFKQLAEVGATEDTLEQTARTIYDRVLRRDATSGEVDSLVAFYDETVDALEGTDEEPAREWAIASCFAVATTLEGLFY